jgi:6-phosphofructokinase 2
MAIAADSATSSRAIATLTMNPALEITNNIDTITTDEMLCGPARHDPCGGGITVARIAQLLGAPVTAVFPAGGATGDFLTELLSATPTRLRRITIAGSTRQNLTVNGDSSGRRYRFILPGPVLTAGEQDACLAQLRGAAESATYVVASGSLPPGTASDFYQHVADICRAYHARLILDTSGTGLRQLNSGAFLLKPDARELCDCIGRTLLGEHELVLGARELIDRGRAEIVLVSLGLNGALLVTADVADRYPPVPVGSGGGLGAGDAMVAAVAVGLSRDWTLDKAVRLGIAAGAAMLRTPGTGLCRLSDLERFFDETDHPLPAHTGPDVFDLVRNVRGGARQDRGKRRGEPAQQIRRRSVPLGDNGCAVEIVERQERDRA